MSARRVPFPHRVCLGCAGAPVSWSAWATWGAMRDATPIVLGHSGCSGTQLPHTPPSFHKLAGAHPPLFSWGLGCLEEPGEGVQPNGASQHPPAHRGYSLSMSLNLLSYSNGCMTLVPWRHEQRGCSPSPTGGMPGFLLSPNYHTRVIKFQLLGVSTQISTNKGLFHLQATPVLDKEQPPSLCPGVAGLLGGQSNIATPDLHRALAG